MKVFIIPRSASDGPVSMVKVHPSNSRDRTSTSLNSVSWRCRVSMISESFIPSAFFLVVDADPVEAVNAADLVADGLDGAVS